MLNLSLLPIYLVAVSVIVICPGPDTLFVLARSLAQGRRAGLVSVVGISAGMCVHITLASVGLSALLVSSAMAFTAVKLLGAGYLIYLGVRSVIDRGVSGISLAPAPMPNRQVFRQGMLTNVLNPKVAIFFLSFMPQFVDPSRGAAGWQIAALGLIFNVLGTVWLIGIVLLSGAAGRWLNGRPEVQRGQRQVTGAIFVGLGLHLIALHRATR